MSVKLAVKPYKHALAIANYLPQCSSFPIPQSVSFFWNID